jgi:hypothetical protein
MSTAHVRSVAIVAVGLLAAGSAAAQESTSGLLNSLEVRQLVARAEPADDARLGAHFTALAGRYDAEAARHMSMSQSFMANPSPSLSIGMSVHCKRLADLNRQSAATAHELAVYHENLASGAPAALPPDAARFQGGAGAPEPTETDLNALAAKASTPGDHRALEEYFVTQARRYTAEAREHFVVAQMFRGSRLAHTAVHHDRLAALARDAAKQANQAAAMHRQLANIGR